MEIDPNYIPKGWQCPVCKRVYSPSTFECFYCGRGTITTVGTATDKCYIQRFGMPDLEVTPTKEEMK